MKQGLTLQKPADPRLLLRRVYLDLIGLPPTLAEQEAFLKDPSPQAYEKTVDRLLASPQYGERWGRHWMDIWRYSDWWGFGSEFATASNTFGTGVIGSWNRSMPTKATTRWSAKCSPRTSSTPPT